MKKKETIKRGKRWKPAETDALIGEMEKWAITIYGKLSSTLTYECKKKAWKEITNTINALGITSEHRTCDQIERKWNDMKGNAKKTVGAYATAMKATGGGINPAKQPTEEDYKIVAIIGRESALGIEKTDDMDTSFLYKKANKNAQGDNGPVIIIEDTLPQTSSLMEESTSHPSRLHQVQASTSQEFLNSTQLSLYFQASTPSDLLSSSQQHLPSPELSTPAKQSSPPQTQSRRTPKKKTPLKIKKTPLKSGYKRRVLTPTSNRSSKADLESNVVRIHKEMLANLIEINDSFKEIVSIKREKLALLQNSINFTTAELDNTKSEVN